MITGKERLSRCRTLFLTFLKIGAFTFGGGYAMIPLIQRETVETHGWVTEEDHRCGRVHARSYRHQQRYFCWV